jgi:hypothetical protein
MEANGDGVVAPWILELIAPVGGVDELDAETLCGGREHARLVAGGRREQKYAFGTLRTLCTLRTLRTLSTLSTLSTLFFHSRATCSAVGSAQQYQGSFM